MDYLYPSLRCCENELTDLCTLLSAINVFKLARVLYLHF